MLDDEARNCSSGLRVSSSISPGLAPSRMGPAHQVLAVSLSNLGLPYRDQEQFDIKLAEPLLTRALSIREKCLGPEHPDTAKTTSDLSLSYPYEKQFKTASLISTRSRLQFAFGITGQV